jgi:ArsR family transcriptional regulator, arsenate/arsenite/antimonite-responsive transcriptional repressor
LAFCDSSGILEIGEGKGIYPERGALRGYVLRILRLLLSAHPEGMVAGDLQLELGIPASTLSHHLDKLKNEELATVRREGTFLWYAANCDALQDLLTFLYAECCTRNQAIKPDVIVKCCR